MNISAGITVKMFVGGLLTAEIKMHLDKSQEWKQISIIPKELREAQIQQIHFQNKDYLGYFLTDDSIAINELQNVKSAIYSFLKKTCPKFQIDTFKVYVFPQVFIS